MDSSPRKPFSVASFLIQESLKYVQEYVSVLKKAHAESHVLDVPTTDRFTRYLDNEHAIHAHHHEQVEEWSREPISARAHRELARLVDVLSLTRAALKEGYELLETIQRKRTDGATNLGP